MREDADSHGASAASLVLIAFVGAAVVVLALLVHGGRSGTIVVQRFAEPLSRVNGPQNRISFVSVSETSADGTATRFLLKTSYGRSAAYGSAVAGDTLEAYIPSRKTIFVLSDSAYEAATTAYFKRRFSGQRTHVVPIPSYTETWLAPGRTSFFKVQLERGNYEQVGVTRVDGRRALKLVPAPGRGSIVFSRQSREQMMLIPAYVTPGSYHPIEERSNGTVRYVWTEYRVLPATTANQRLVSLTAAYPGSHISYSATAYVRAAFSTAR